MYLYKCFFDNIVLYDSEFITLVQPFKTPDAH